MSKSIVFDLGGTLMEYAGMPLNWSEYYICGFEKLNEIMKLNLSFEKQRYYLSAMKKKTI